MVAWELFSLKERDKICRDLMRDKLFWQRSRSLAAKLPHEGIKGGSTFDDEVKNALQKKDNTIDDGDDRGIFEPKTERLIEDIQIFLR